MDGHREKRENDKSTSQYMSYSANVLPVITGLRTGTGVKGQSKAIVEVENGSLMRFQWQVKNEAGAWEDIFGATSSQYTLGYQFKAGQTYTLRCRITNPAGAATFTEGIEITAAATQKSAALQSK